MTPVEYTGCECDAPVEDGMCTECLAVLTAHEWEEPQEESRMRMTTIKVPATVADALRSEAKKRRVTVQVFTEDCLRGALKVRGVDVDR